MDKDGGSNLPMPNKDFQKILYLVNISLFQAPECYKSEVKNKFVLLAFTLLRQRQLARTKFSCTCYNVAFENYLKEHQDVMPALKEVDPLRVIWVHEKILETFLIQAGQWVRLCKFENDTKSEFICQIMPMPAQALPSSDYCEIKVHPVTEFNVRKSLECPSFLSVGNLQIKPLLTNPVIKTTNKSLSFTPIHAKSVQVNRLKCLLDVPLKECDILIKDWFVNTKYFCVGDVISLPISVDSQLHLILAEINGKRLNDADGCKELFKISQPSASVTFYTNEITSHFNPAISNERLEHLIPPCLNVPFKKVCDKIEQGLKLSYFSRTNSTATSSQVDLWPAIIVYGVIGTGKTTICQVAAKRFGLNFHLINAANLIGDTSAYTEAKLRAVLEKIKNSLCPAVVLIKNLHLIGKDKEGHEDKRIVLAFKDFIQDVATLSLSAVSRKNVMISKAVFIVGSTDQPNNLIPSISQILLFKIQSVGFVSSTFEIESTLQWLFNRGKVKIERGINLRNWTKENFEGMQRSYGDLKAMAAIVIRHAFVRKMNTEMENNTLQKPDAFEINIDDLNAGIRAIDLVYKKAASAIEIPKVYWEDIGGMDDVKKELISSVRLPLEFPHLFSSGVRRSGILLYGPPGTGKTLIAKAVATEFKLSFLSVKGPELLNMYVGQSEQNVRDVFAKARDAAPCIIFFDELDSLAPNRGRAGDSGGVMDRVVSQILAELDGTHSTTNVFIIGATNRPDLIDPALLRPGRFDKLLYVGINEDIQSKCSVLKALTRKFHLDKDVCLDNVSSLLPKGMSGADMYSLCCDAYMTAVERQISQLSLTLKSDPETEEKAKVIVTFQDFHNAITRATPSISDNEYARYEALKALKR